MIFSKKDREDLITLAPGELGAIVNGRMLPLEDVSDEVFSQKILGDGVAFYSRDGVVYSPCAGTVGMVAETGHAISVTTADEVDILLHIGINTVAEHGKGFTVLVRQGDRVLAGQRLIVFDRRALEKRGYDMVIPMVLAEWEELHSLEKATPGTCVRGQTALRYRK